MDALTLAIAKKYAESLSLGFSTVEDLGNGVVRFTLTSGGSIDVEVPTVKGDKGDKGDTGDTGEKGEKGDTGSRGAIGIGITSVEKTITVGLTDTYTITYSDGSTSTFDIINGANVTKTSQLTNDSDFVSSTAINLVNYYLKSEVYTKSAVDELLRNVGAGLSVKIVTELPTEDISGTTIYLINTSGSQYNQYMYIDDDWANLGSTSVDMSSYYNKTQIDNKLLEYITASALLSQLMNYTKTTDLATVARTNSYNDLDDLPEIPSTDGFMKARENIGEVDLDECTTAGLFAVKTTSDNLPDIPNIYGTYVALDVLTTTEFANQLVKLVVKHDDDTLEPMIWSRGIIFEDDVWGDWHQAYSDITTYTKDEIDTELDLKADKSTTYTKTETDALLDDKADTDDVYTKTEVDETFATKPTLIWVNPDNNASFDGQTLTLDLSKYSLFFITYLRGVTSGLRYRENATFNKLGSWFLWGPDAPWSDDVYYRQVDVIDTGFVFENCRKKNGGSTTFNNYYVPDRIYAI